MELNFKTLEVYVQDYIDGTLPTITVMRDGKEYQKSISFIEDLNKVSESQRLAFMDKYIEYVMPKQLRRGTSIPSGDMDFTFKIIKHKEDVKKR